VPSSPISSPREQGRRQQRLRVAIRASGAYDLFGETFLLLMIEPALEGPTHRMRDERLLTTPTNESALWRDGFGNPQRRLVAPAGPFTFDFSGTVEIAPNRAVPDDALEHAARDLPAETLVYTLPSRYCQSDRLSRMALSEFGDLPRGGRRVRAVADWIRTHVEYRYGTTDAMTSAYDTAVQRVGVCRDFAHLVIAFCRALGIPARYVSGYALGLTPPDFHGYAQVYVGNAWHNVDATFAGVRPALVPIAIGRDAADVAMLTLWGEGAFREQNIQVSESDPDTSEDAVQQSAEPA
jgi:transglutaminase-like putative cysteine protease